ncbi:hypothetical protein P154DRAFT_595084 [Amniculicola lignicola CBS 123094]|uniref:Uncharacterized protein n=1 Tax=Amniculicola lignicola CBS 123094 TaxID=1392246 RepID=A0A6A5WSV3_9PLEO|nr:hypothetical protein P154DRAFT_595084 [Amniculicola lignicola CBS 123094]
MQNYICFHFHLPHARKVDSSFIINIAISTMKLVTLTSSALVFTASTYAQLLGISIGLGLGGKTSTTTPAVASSTSKPAVIPSVTSSAIPPVTSSTIPSVASSVAPSSLPAPDDLPTHSNGSPLVQQPLAILKGVVDTILNTTGIARTDAVMNTFLTPFCTKDGTYQAACKSIQNTVAVCVDSRNNCSDSTTRQLLRTVITLDPCGLTPTGTLVNKICTGWFNEGKRCDQKTVRGPCSINHVKYLLRQFRDFLNLPKSQISIVQKKVVTKNDQDGGWPDDAANGLGSRITALKRFRKRTFI